MVCRAAHTLPPVAGRLAHMPPESSMEGSLGLVAHGGSNAGDGYPIL